MLQNSMLASNHVTTRLDPFSSKVHASALSRAAHFDFSHDLGRNSKRDFSSNALARAVDSSQRSRNLEPRVWSEQKEELMGGWVVASWDNGSWRRIYLSLRVGGRLLHSDDRFTDHTGQVRAHPRAVIDLNDGGATLRVELVGESKVALSESTPQRFSRLMESYVEARLGSKWALRIKSDRSVADLMRWHDALQHFVYHGGPTGVRKDAYVDIVLAQVAHASEKAAASGDTQVDVARACVPCSLRIAPTVLGDGRWTLALLDKDHDKTERYTPSGIRPRTAEAAYRYHTVHEHIFPERKRWEANVHAWRGAPPSTSLGFINFGDDRPVQGPMWASKPAQWRGGSDDRFHSPAEWR